MKTEQGNIDPNDSTIYEISVINDSVKDEMENSDPNSLAIYEISVINNTGFNFREDLVDRATEGKYHPQNVPMGQNLSSSFTFPAEITTLMDLEDSIEDDRTMQTTYNCPICNEAFLGKEAIKNHVKRYYKYDCDVCKKIYFREKYLRRHRMNAHLESKQLVCPLCNKEFRAVYNLKQHLHLHSDEKTYVCTFEGCNKRFRQRPGLQQHVRLCHKAKMKLKCPYCDEDVLRLSKSSSFYFSDAW